jgi:hypothetical protein
MAGLERFPALFSFHMNFDEFKPLPVSRMGGMVDYQGKTKVLSGCAVLAQSIRFTPDTAGTRYGTLTTMAYQRADNQNADITGIDVLEVLGQINAGYRAIAFDSIGDLFIENPDGSGVLVPLSRLSRFRQWRACEPPPAITAC